MLHPVRVLELPTGMSITLGVGRRQPPRDAHEEAPPPPSPTARPTAPSEDDA